MIIEIHQLITVIVFVSMISLIIWNKFERHWIALGVLIVLFATGTATITDLMNIEYDVFGLIIGMGIFTSMMESSGLTDNVVSYLQKRAKSTKTLTYLTILFGGFLSLILDNVSVVLVFAPIVLRIAENSMLNPIPLILGLAAVANMSGSATMVGDPPAIIVSGFFKLSFLDFFLYNGRPSMFFITVIPMVASSYIYVSRYFTSGKHMVVSMENRKSSNSDEVFQYEVMITLVGLITLLSTRHLHKMPLSLTVAICIGGLLLTRILRQDHANVKNAIIKGFDLKTLIFLLGVFLVSNMFERHGIAQSIAECVVNLATGNKFLLFTSIYILSHTLSVFLDNIPITTTLIPLSVEISRLTGINPVSLMWSALAGLTAGGNYTFISSSATLMAVRVLEKKGLRISIRRYFKTLLPLNLANTILTYTLFLLFMCF